MKFIFYILTASNYRYKYTVKKHQTNPEIR